MITAAEFPVVDRLIHLNHAAVGPWPRRASDALQAFAEENSALGSLNYAQWLKTEASLRDRLARLINARSTDEIALLKNTSEGLSMVAQGLPWESGDNVVGIAQEFPSNRFAWEALHEQGVAYRKLDLRSTDDPEQALIDLCDRDTRLIAVSAVQFADGLRLDIARLGEFCRANGILLCVDAIQQLGALPFDVQAAQADFVVADGHKWLLSAEGLALFYVRSEVMDRLRLQQYGWHMVDSPGDYTQQDFRPAANAQRFECGSPNMAGAQVMHASVGLLLEQGMQSVGERVLDNSDFLANALATIDGVEVASDTRAERRSGIVTFTPTRRDPDELYRHLSTQSVLCAQRGGGIRLSPHFYTPRPQLYEVIDLVRAFVTA